MIHKIKLYELRRAIRNIIIEADEEEDRRGPVAKMKGWQPPQNMVSGTDMAGDEFIDDTLDEADEDEE